MTAKLSGAGVPINNIRDYSANIGRVRYLHQNLCYRPKERKKTKGEG